MTACSRRRFLTPWGSMARRAITPRILSANCTHIFTLRCCGRPPCATTASTLALLEAMHAPGIKKLVFSSTAAVYGEPETIPIAEDARLAPTNACGESKLLVEYMLHWFQRVHGLRYASLHYIHVADLAAAHILALDGWMNIRN